MKSRINFITQYYFPGRLVWAIVGGLGALGLFAAHLFGLSFFMLMIGVVTSTTHYGVEINLKSKQYREYIWILGFRKGEEISFDSIQYLFIKDFRISETFNSRVNSSTIVRNEFRGFVKFSEESKIHIVTKDDYEKMVIQLKKLAKQFDVGLVDYTFGNRIQLI